MTSSPMFDSQGFTLTGPSEGEGRFSVLNDAPVGESGDADLLEVTESARSLADLILASRGAAPFTLAIDAAWGMGKSSLMHRLEATLAAEKGVSTVWFNAWTSGRASALEGLIKSVLLRFDRNVIRRAVRSMSRRTHLIGMLRAFALVLGSFFGLGRVVDEMWRAMALDAKSRNQIKGVLREMFDGWITRGGRGDRRRLLVVFVDDLDRCANERIVEVCEAIKLYLDVPGVVFVLACDQSVLWRAVRDSGGIQESASAVEYLEKIIQINYRIPVPSTSLALRLVDGYLEMSRTSRLFEDSMKNLIIERSGRNPRRIKRLINSFVLEYHLNRSWDEIGVENLVKVVLLQHFYPGFYRLLANPRAEDPIVEFLKYHGFRSAVRQGGGERDATQWQELFADRGLRPPPAKADDGVLAAHLERLERELPAEFPLLAADRDFVGLVGSLNGPVSSRQLRQQLRRPLTPDFAAEYRYVPRLEQHWVGFEARNVPRTPLSVSVPRSGLTGLAGLRILWIDDQPLTNQRVIDFLTAQGARVTAATDRATALDAFKTAKPSVVLSDFGRDGVPDAGIDDMEYFRENGVYDGPVIFCSGRGTAERQARLTQLGALGPTNDENEIVRLVMQIAAKD